MFNMFSWFLDLFRGLVSLPILVYPFAAAFLACCFKLVYSDILSVRRSRQ